MSSILFFGDVVGEPGRTALLRELPSLRQAYKASFVVVNGENAAGGKGITPKLAQELLAHGVDVITLGDHVWDQNDLVPWLDSHEPTRVLRPLNLQEGSPGCGSCVLDTPMGRVAVMSLMGRTFMRPMAENPYPAGLKEAARLREMGACVQIVDFHAEATSEKIALGYALDGHVTAVLGTHTHVLTADARVLEGGTAYLTDAGMCGPLNGVIGREKGAVVESMQLAMPRKIPVAGWPVQLCGAAIHVDWDSGRALSIENFCHIYQKA